MNNKEFDDHIKEQLGRLSPQVPAHVWENIVAGKDNKKPVGFWGLFTGINIAAAVLLLLITGSLVYLFAKHDAAPLNENIIVRQQSNGTDKNSISDEHTASPLANSENQNNNNSNNNHANTDNNTATDPTPINNSNPVSTNTKTDHNRYVPGRATISLNEPGSENELTAVHNTDDATARYIFLHSMLAKADLFKTSAFVHPKIKIPFAANNLTIPCPTAERNAAGNKRYIEVYGGPDYTFRNISDTSSSYAQTRRNSAKQMLSYSAGVRYTKVFKNGMSFRGGINYSQINEAFSYEKGHIIQNVYITDAAGDTTGTYTVSGTQYKKSTNKFRSIDIPLAIGYEAGNGRVHTNLNAGVMINVMSRQSGFVPDKNGNPVDISSGSAKTIYRYKTNAGVSLTGAVSVYYKLNDALHLMAEPYFRYSLSSVTQSEISLKQKYHTAGMRLGVRLDF